MQVDNNISNKQLFPIIVYPKILVKKRDQQKKNSAQKKQTSNEEIEIKDFFNSHFIMRKDIPDVIFFEQIEFLV